MKAVTQFEIPAHESGPVLDYRREAHEACNCTGRTIPEGHIVGLQIRGYAASWCVWLLRVCGLRRDVGEVRIVRDLGPVR